MYNHHWTNAVTKSSSLSISRKICYTSGEEKKESSQHLYEDKIHAHTHKHNQRENQDFKEKLKVL